MNQTILNTVNEAACGDKATERVFKMLQRSQAFALLPLLNSWWPAGEDSGTSSS